MDPFSGMSQDEMKKLDEVLQSEQARAILRETTSSHGRPGEDSSIMNSSMESLSGLSDLVDNLALEANSGSNIFAVPNDEDVVNIATDIFHGNLSKAFEADHVLMDHCYSLPAEDTKFDILADGKSSCRTAESQGNDDGGDESTDSANSPVSEHEQLPHSAKIGEDRNREEKSLYTTTSARHHEEQKLAHHKGSKPSEERSKPSMEQSGGYSALTAGNQESRRGLFSSDFAKGDAPLDEFERLGKSVADASKFLSRTEHLVPANSYTDQVQVQTVKHLLTGGEGMSSNEASSLSHNQNHINMNYKSTGNSSQEMLKKDQQSCEKAPEKAFSISEPPAVIPESSASTKNTQSIRLNSVKESAIEDSCHKSTQRVENPGHSETAEEGGSFKSARETCAEMQKTVPLNQRPRRHSKQNSSDVQESKGTSSNPGPENVQKKELKRTASGGDAKPVPKTRTQNSGVEDDSGNARRTVKKQRTSASQPEEQESKKSLDKGKTLDDKNKKNTSRVNKTRKKSLSVSEDKKETKASLESKKRRLSAGSGNIYFPKTGAPLKVKVTRPKKKTLRNDSISADLLGPALFSNPDVMVKVKTDDACDEKSEKSKSTNKGLASDESETAEAVIKNNGMPEIGPKILSELDMIRAEVDLETRAVKEDKVAEPMDVSETECKEPLTETDEKSSGKKEPVKPEGKENAEPTILQQNVSESAALQRQKATIVASTNAVQSKAAQPKLTRSISDQLGGAAGLPGSADNTGGSNDHSGAGKRKQSSSEQQQLEPRAIRGVKQTTVEGNRCTSHENPSSEADKVKKTVEAVVPERKSQRIHKKRKIYEDESPEREKQKRERKQNVNTNKNTGNPKKVGRKKGAEQKAKKGVEQEEEEEEPGKTMEYSDDPEDSDWNSDDDPEKLWCICRQPHNNKFMIQCDKCEDWFHGTCVSVTRQLGRQLEKEGKEWMCPNCNKGQAAKASQPSLRGGRSSAGRGTRRQSSTTLKEEPPPPTVTTSASTVSGSSSSSIKSESRDVKPPVLPTSKKGMTDVQQTTVTGAKTPKSEPAEDTKSIKVETEGREMKSRERLTRSTIPKNYILKSRDPLKREKAAATEKLSTESEGITSRTEVPKREGRVAKTEVSPTKTQKTPARPEKPSVKTETLKSESFFLEPEKTKSEPSTPAKAAVQKTPVAAKTSEPDLATKESVHKDSKPAKDKNSAVSKKAAQVTPSKEKQKHSSSEKSLGNMTVSKGSGKESSKNTASKSEKSETVKKKSESPLKDRKMHPSKRKYDCIVCSKPAPQGSIYCTESCLEKYATESLKIIQSSLKANEELNTKKVVVIDRQTGNLSTGVGAPVASELTSWLKSNPTFEVVRPSVPATAKKEQQQKTEKIEERQDDSEESGIRSNVRKTLKNILLDRCKGAEDINASEEDIQKIAVKIEDELYKCFKDLSSKYRAKYRSLMFNIKDPRNQGLFRKILKGKVPPDKLVRMSPEELASKELAKWREKENQHSLDMIKRMQIEQQQASAGLRKKTHKGEIEIEEEVAVVGLEQEIEKDLMKTPPRPAEETIEVTPEKKEEKKEEKETEKDTTSSHRSHLFDLNCKICTGKMAPPPPEEPAPKKVRVAHSISVEQVSPKVSESSDNVFTSPLDAHSLLSVAEASDDSIDREPSSTTHSSPDSSTFSKKSDIKSPSSVWKGFIYMQEVAKFVTCAYKVSGPTDFLYQDIPDTVQVCGRITPEQVYEYLSKIKQSGHKELTIIRFRPANNEESATYNEFYKYLSTRKRYGVVNPHSKKVKDFYIIPLAAQSPVPSVLLPFNGPGLPSVRPHLLLGVLVRHRIRQSGSLSESKAATSNEEDVSYTPPLEGTSPCEEGSYTPPLEEHSYTPPLEDQSYTPPQEDQSYTPPLEDRSSTPPLEGQSFTPPLRKCPSASSIENDSFTPPLPEQSYTPPLPVESYTPPLEGRSYTPPLDDGSYTPPLEGGSYTPPLPSESGLQQGDFSSTFSSMMKSKKSLSSRKASQYVPYAVRNLAAKRGQDEYRTYELSGSSPLEKQSRNSEDESDDMQPYDPEHMDQSLTSTGAQYSMQIKSILGSVGNSKGSPSSQSDASILESPAELERQKRLLHELHQKVQETDRQVYQSLNVLKQLGATRSDVPDIDMHTPPAPDRDDSSSSSNALGMSSFLNLPQKLQDIFTSVQQQPGGSKADVDSRLLPEAEACSSVSHITVSEQDSDMRQLPSFTFADHSKVSVIGRNSEGSFDIDERSSSQGGTPPPCGDDDGESSSELRPSDPRIKIRTSFQEDQFSSEGTPKTLLSSMSKSELVERAAKELAAIKSPLKQSECSSSTESVMDQYPVRSWETHNQEPPPPGIGPPEMLSADSSAFASDSSSTSQSSAAFPPSASVPEGQALAPPFVPAAPPPPPTPTVPPPMFPTHVPPPGFPLHAAGVSPQAPPPALPPAFLPPPPPVPSHVVPPEGVNQRDERYVPWPPEGRGPQDLDYVDQQRNWDKRDWKDWDHRAPFDRERIPPPPEFFPGREHPEEWYREQRRRDFYPEDIPPEGVPHWDDEEWEYHQRFERGRPRHFAPPRFQRGHRRDDHWRGNGRRRVFSRPHRD